MLTMHIPSSRWWDEDQEIFRETKAKTIQLEHSLISLSKWEAQWKKAFLKEKQHLSVEETVSYLKCMCLTQSVDDDVFNTIAATPDLMQQVHDYIDDPMTATVINRPMGAPNGRPKKETVTSELIYSWMINGNIPVEFQKWHLNRLLTLIEVIGVENERAQAKSPYKKSTPSQLRNRASLNAQRRAAHHSRG